MEDLCQPVFDEDYSVDVPLGGGSRKLLWHENVLRCRETLELLVMVSIVKNAAKKETERPLMSLDKAALVPSRFEIELCCDDVRVKKLDDLDVFEEEHEGELEETDGLCIVRGPLSMAGRCAFLSVLHQYSPSSTSSEEPQRKKLRPSAPTTDRAHDFGGFDPTVIASIFAFAAERATREICVNTTGRLPARFGSAFAARQIF